MPTLRQLYQAGGLVSAEPSSTGVHGNIDNLMLQSKLDEVYDPGVMYAPRTLGQRATEWLPSKHRDPIKAKEQERGLQEFIDFVVPQTKTDVALELMPFGGVIKSVAKKVPEIAKMVKKAGITSPLYHHTGMEKAEGILEEGFIKGKGSFPGQDVWPYESRWKSVSTTRDPGFLTRPHGHVGTDISFVFDRPSLKKAGYKVKPFAESGFHKTRPDIDENWMNPRFEFEERVRGNLSLKDLKMINVESIGDLYTPKKSFSEKLLLENKFGTPVIFSNKAKSQIRKRIDNIKLELIDRKGESPLSFTPKAKKFLRKEKTTLKSLLKLPSYKSPFKKPKSKYHEKWAEEEDLLMAQGGYF